MKLKNFIISIILTFSLCGCVTTKISEEQVYCNKAIENDNNSQYEGAFIYYSKVIDLNKDNSLAYFKRATVSYKLKKIEQAIDDLTYVIEYSTELKYDSLFNRGSIFYELAQYDKALSDFLYAIKLNPQHAYTYTMAGNCYSYQKNYKKAVQYYEQALEINPDDEQAKKNLATLRKYNY